MQKVHGRSHLCQQWQLCNNSLSSSRKQIAVPNLSWNLSKKWNREEKRKGNQAIYCHTRRPTANAHSDPETRTRNWAARASERASACSGSRRSESERCCPHAVPSATASPERFPQGSHAHWHALAALTPAIVPASQRTHTHTHMHMPLCMLSHT